ncbi:hypothetical protein [Streptomyces canus]|uniref:hypothetical protein n=1 Tax=Streptomyces canus TaxID=58343 RepID=UPI003830D321
MSSRNWVRDMQRPLVLFDLDNTLVDRRGTLADWAVKLLKTHRQVAFVHTMSRMIGDFDGLTISSYPCREELVLRKHHVPTSIVYRRDDAIHGGLYDPDVRKWGDWAFAVNLLAGRFRRGEANHIVCISGPLHEYRVHSRTRWVSSLEAVPARRPDPDGRVRPRTGPEGRLPAAVLPVQPLRGLGNSQVVPAL